MPYKILVIEDDIAMAEIIKAYLSGVADISVTVAQTGEDGVRQFNRQRYDVVLLDLHLPDRHGLEVLDDIKAINTECTVIVLTGETSVAVAVEAMKRGANDFVSKPITPERLNTSVKNAVERKELTEIANNYEKISRKTFQSFVGQSPHMQAIYNVIENAANIGAPIVITGEEGTGKNMAARAIHDLSPRSQHGFEVVKCSDLPHHLIESELFGHTRGAVKESAVMKIGAVAKANKGTLFLDDITALPKTIQKLILNCLRTGQFTPKGGEAHPIDIRIICSMTTDPLKAIEAGFLLEDLYYRLNVMTLSMPPLRERGKEDILMLSSHFMEYYNRVEGKKFVSFMPEAEERLIAYSWPGNVHELQDVIRDVIVLNQGKTIKANMLKSMDESRYRKILNEKDKDFLPHKHDDIRALKDYERDLIEQAIAVCNNNITEAAKRLDINPATIHRKRLNWQKEKG